MSPEVELRRRRRSSAFPGGLLTVVKVGACLGAMWIGVRSSTPFLMAANIRAENARLEALKAKLQLDYQERRKELAAAKRPDAIEHQARLAGYVMPGEATLVLPSDGGR